MKPVETERLREQFLQLWERLLPECNEQRRYDGVNRLFAVLHRSYAEPWRAYHNLDHIRAMLFEFAMVWHLAKEPDLVELAIWCHDVVCVLGRDDNELRSTKFLRTQVSKVFPEFPIQKFACTDRYIMATCHRGSVASDDERLIADIDIANLGKSWEEFSANDDAVGREYLTKYTPEQWREGRADFFRSMLAKPRIYQHPHFYWLLEKSARCNMQRAIDRAGAV